MLETALVAAGTGLVVSILVHGALSGGLRLRLWRVERALAEVMDVQTREVKQRAAARSVEARAAKANAFDQAMIQKHVGAGVEAPAEEVPGGGMFDFVTRLRR